MNRKMGTLISFSGIDGAGKSTQVRLLSDYFKKQGREFYVSEEMFGYFLLKPVVKHLRTVTNSPKGGPVTRNNSLLLKLWFVPAFIDIWLRHLFVTKPRLSKYDYVVADRFYIDIWANLLYYGYCPDWAFRLLIRFLPRTDCSILFSVEPEIVLKREDDFPKNYYIEQRKIYERLGKILDLNVINANLSPKKVSSQIIAYVDKSH